jgi:serralysin
MLLSVSDMSSRANARAGTVSAGSKVAAELNKEESMSTAFRAVLEGSQEVPPNSSTVHGLGTVIFDSATVAADYSFQVFGLDFGPITGIGPVTEDVQDDVVGMHYHNAERGVNGPIVFGQLDPAQDSDDLGIALNEDGSWTVSGVWETTDPANVSITNFADTLGSAAVGSEIPLYFNIHTTALPEGEIRGQLIAIADDNNNVVEGTDGNDVLPGLGGDDIIIGLAGDDNITTGEGNNLVFGGDGNDTIVGGDGNDIIEGGNGDDTLTGGGGADLFASSEFRTDTHTVTDFEVGTDNILLAGEAEPNVEESDEGAVITFGSTTIVLAGVSAEEVNVDDFLII